MPSRMSKFIVSSTLVALAVAAASAALSADTPTKISLPQFYVMRQSLYDSHTEIQVSGVYARLIGIDLLYNDGPDAQTQSLAPIGRPKPISLWIGSAPKPISTRFNQCVFHPDTVKTKAGEFAGQCDVTIIGHVDMCAAWGVGSPGETLLRLEPTRLLPGPPPGSQVIPCLVVDGGNAE